MQANTVHCPNVLMAFQLMFLMLAPLLIVSHFVLKG